MEQKKVLYVFSLKINETDKQFDVIITDRLETKVKGVQLRIKVDIIQKLEILQLLFYARYLFVLLLERPSPMHTTS
jgi:hypothetical protein